jgi:hypothetical protein
MQVGPIRPDEVDNVAERWNAIEGNADRDALVAAANDEGWATALVASAGTAVAGYALALETAADGVAPAVTATAPVRR